MQPIPEDILSRFNTVMEQKSVPAGLRDEYRKWLKYYLDFRVKYPPPDKKSEQVRLLLIKCGQDVRTTMIYTHCAPNKTINELKSPLDF